MEIRKEQFLAALMAFGLGASACSKDEPPAEEPIEDTAGEEEPMMDEPAVDEPMDDGMSDDGGEEVYEPAAE